MSIKINIPLFLQHATNGVKVVSTSGGTVEECLSDLVKQFPSIDKALLDENGKLHYHLGVWINKENLYSGLYRNPIKDGDEFDIMPLYFGG